MCRYERETERMTSKINNLLLVVAPCLIILFWSGCVATGEYVYREKVLPPPEEEVIIEKVEAEEEKEEEKWIGSSWGRSQLFVKQCPICQRRYPANEINCPYDGAGLEPINH